MDTCGGWVALGNETRRHEMGRGRVDGRSSGGWWAAAGMKVGIIHNLSFPYDFIK